MTSVEPSGRKAAKVYPYAIACTRCDTRLITVDREWVMLVGPLPIEVVGSLDSDVHIACHVCGTLVPVDRELLTIR